MSGFETPFPKKQPSLVCAKSPHTIFRMRCGKPEKVAQKRLEFRSLALCGHVSPPPSVWKPQPGDDNNTNLGRVRDTQQQCVPRHSQQMPSERHPFHPSGFRRPRRRVGWFRTTWLSQRVSTSSHRTPSEMSLGLALHRDSAHAILRCVRVAATRDALSSQGSDDWWLAWDHLDL